MPLLYTVSPKLAKAIHEKLHTDITKQTGDIIRSGPSIFVRPKSQRFTGNLPVSPQRHLRFPVKFDIISMYQARGHNRTKRMWYGA